MKRRGFFKKIATTAIGAVLGLVPLASGIVFLLDPLRRSKKQRSFARVASLDTLPVGVPRRFTISGNRTDAWNRYPYEPIGAVYLIRHENDQVDAFQVICPHAGCSVDYDAQTRRFRCPCHESSFKLDGSIANPAKSPAARGLDELQVRLQEQDVLVRYQEFRQGTTEQIPLS